MSEQRTGEIGWTDLTVPNAEEVRDFYEAVVGWQPSGLDMGGYEDYNMTPSGADKPVAGVCHSRGVNEGLPPAWLIYIVVDDLDKSVKKAEDHGGKVLRISKNPDSQGEFSVIQDPAGAVCALYSK